MNLKKMVLALGLLLITSWAHAAAISGSVDIAAAAKSKLTDKGVLFVFARKAGDDGTKGMPPVAVLRIANPKFPQAFTLTEGNVMMPGTPFEGSLNVSARYSPSGDALDKSGPKGNDKKNKTVKIGFAKLKIVIE